MNENEEYGIKLTAETSLFKKRMKELVAYTKAFGKGVGENFREQVSRQMGRFSESFQFNDKDFQKRIDLIKEEMDAVQKQMEALKNGKGTGNLEDLETEYDRLSKKLEYFISLQKQSNGEQEETGNTAKKTSVNLGSMFDKSISKIKRFTFYLLGARSAFSLFRKYQSIYYQYNEQMQYQSELSQNAIALSLAPAFEFLGNVIAYASIGFAKFIELLTGVNVLSKVSTKGIRDNNKALKEQRSLLSGIDEITNVDNSKGTGTGLASQYQALADFQKKVKEVENFFKKNTWIKGLADGIKTVIARLKDVVNYIKEHWDVFKYIIGGVALTTFLGFALTGAGLGTMALVATITVLGIAEIGKAIDEIKKLNQLTHDIGKNRIEKWPDIFREVTERIKGCEKGTEEWQKNADSIHELTYGVLNDIIGGKLEYEEYAPIVDDLLKRLQGLDDEEFDADIKILMETKTAKNDYEKFLKSINGRTLNLSIKGVVTGVTSGAKALEEAVNKILNPHAQGLDYVPYDNYPALLHKGESVVPAKYNPTIHSAGNEYTNSLLETLIYKVEDLANRPNVFEIDGQKFATATYGLYDSERKRQGYVEGVVR